MKFTDQSFAAQILYFSKFTSFFPTYGCLVRSATVGLMESGFPGDYVVRFQLKRIASWFTHRELHLLTDPASSISFSHTVLRILGSFFVQIVVIIYKA